MGFAAYESANETEFSVEKPGGNYTYTVTVLDCLTEGGALLGARAISPALLIFDGRYHKLTRLAGKNVGPDTWKVRCEYSPVEPNDKEPMTWTLRFSTKGATQNIKVGKSQARFGLPGYDAPDLGGAINFNGQEVEGVEVPIGSLTFSFTVYYPAAFMTPTFMKELARKTPRVNNQPWAGFDRGELRFLGGDGEYDPSLPVDGMRAPVPITLDFEASENLVNLEITNPVLSKKITIPQKYGWDHLAVRFFDMVDAATGKKYIVPMPFHAYVTRVHDELDFAAFFGFNPF